MAKRIKRKSSTGRSGRRVGTRRVGRTIKRSKTQTGTSNKSIDKTRKALPPGKRISKNGNIYYERRANRSDINAKTRL